LESADELDLVTTGQRVEGELDERHFGVRQAERVLGHTRFRLRVHSDIPVARGLGSSAALALACAVAARASDPLAFAAETDGHAENAAASFAGGLVTAAMIDGAPVFERLRLDPALRFVVVVPEVELATDGARAVLPSTVPFGDATFNLSRLGLLIAGLADHDRLRSYAMDDRLHQPYRSSLLSFATPLLQGLRDAGALATCWSGAGSSMLAVVAHENANDVANAGRRLLGDLSVPGDVLVLDADTTGLVQA
jgi:homoserine kinase